MNLGIEDKVVIVTGGSKGIGEAIVRSLAEEKAIPVIVGRSFEKGEEVRKELEAKGLKAHNIAHELGGEVSCEVVIKEIVDKFGSIYGLVNNAGVNDGIGLENGSPEGFEKSVTSNLGHYYDMAHFCLPYLKKEKGSIVNVSSKTAVTGQGKTSGYAASNGAQLSLTREWAVELAPYGIRVNAIVPAEVMTPQYKTWIDTFPDPEAVIKKIAANIPLEQRLTRAEEIASMTVFLLSNKSLHTTGQWIYVDGGYVHLDRAMAGNGK